MNILVICQYYYPEPFRIDDICTELVKRGHTASVITGLPNYPEGKIYDGYEDKKNTDETVNGVNVHRCGIIPRKTGPFFRYLNYISYRDASSRYVRSNALDGFDVVLVYQLSPVMMAYAAFEYKKKYGAPVVLYCLDLWPQSLCSGGIKKGSPVYRHYHRVSEKIYKQADRLLVSSRSFDEYFEKEFSINNVGYLPQYAEDVFMDSKKEKKSDGKAIDLLFAGNIGAAQSVDTILSAAALLKDEGVSFHIAGGGSELSRLKNAADANSLKNVTFYGRLPLDRMPAMYSDADAALITLCDDPELSLTLPGKLQSYMAAGKPVIAAANGEISRVIEDSGCGYCGPAEDAAALAENIMRFARDKDKECFGKRAEAYYKNNFSKSVFMQRLENELSDAVRGKRG